MRLALVLSIGLLAAAWWCWGAIAAEKGDKPHALPALKVENSAPLLLLDEPKKKDSDEMESKPAADNEPCYVCHGNYREEPMVHWHAKANVGCMKCHGESLAHRDDEDHTTPPDVMYASADIDRACVKCHDEHNAPAKKVIARWKQRCPSKTDPNDLVCTDCHGEHRLAKREVRWDKKTRKVIVQHAK